ncbi:ABC transporter, periplasmic spermidine putrescine-binding protein PotD [Roseibacterium elongatum DSM 19469]|uniref:ABC transporter, periplasmic spermidine putrescine-binding protein PotD n=1 Tax=Roseicyclus elongatus DSM 19469 TaxID=1294273 RepID=W8S4D6_9RHOB|nr:ABC transporter substrate-binding protein [Roseibacterium elongatum]AHM05057.1 ABC transporter, periplasmic spermidine putrescine-binding protein PotD [Roseibacterium elongatum DSM 19469]
MNKTFTLGTAITLALSAPAFSQDLLVFDYSGFEDPSFHQPYVEAHGGSPEFVFFGDEDEAFQRLLAGFRSDVTHICAGSVPRWQASGIIEPWDTDRIAAFADLNSDLVGADVLAGSSELFFLPTDYGSTAVVYNTDEVPAEDVASLEIFTNPAYAGRVSIPDNVDDAYALAYLATGVSDWSDVTDAQFEAATAWLRGIHENLLNYWGDPAELQQQMASGQILASWAWNEVPVALADEGFPVGFARNTTEGTSVWLCGYVNMAEGEGSEDLAYDYVNALLSEASAGPLLENGFGSANDAALQAQGAEALEASGLGEVSVPVLAQLPISNEQRERQAEAFERIKAGF